MAEVNFSVDQNQFSCTICLEILKDPVTIPCGHSYCMGCIKGCWDQDNHTGVYSCPQCRETFTPRPDLRKNTMFAEVVEQFKKAGLQATPDHCYSGPADVVCDFCTGRKFEAVKSCLVCLASFCETHLQPHYESLAFKRHKLVKATGNLQEKICSHHDKLLEVYCRTEQQCVCLLCVMDEHKDHDTVSAAAERTEKQKQLGATQSKFQQRIQEREKELQDLRQAVQSLKLSAQAAVEDSERIFTELIRSIERRRSEVKELIRDQEKAEVSRAEGLLERLEQEIAELRWRDAELEQLSHTEDHIHFLQSCQSLCVPPGSGDFPNIIVRAQVSFEAVRKSVSELKERLEDACKGELVKVSEAVKDAHTIEPRTREDFLQYYCQLTLDPNTSHRHLYLSEGNREVTHVEEAWSYPDHPERFDHWEQVLCREGLSGCCYWEAEWIVNGGTECSVDMETESSGDLDTVHDEAIETNSSDDMETELTAFFDAMWEEVVDSEWSGDESGDRSEDEESDSSEDWEAESEWITDHREGKGVEIGVSYKDISREGAGDDCALGNNSESWMLYCSPSNYSFWHNNESTKIPVPSSSRIGVYLDHRAGTLSFYSISDTMTLLHRVQTTFTQPLYPGFWVQDVGSSVKLCNLV